jgi:hypothetical protein
VISFNPTAIELQRKGPGRLQKCSGKGRDGYRTAAEGAGTAIVLQWKGPGRLWNCSGKSWDSYRTAAERVGIAKQRKGMEKTGNAGKHSNTLSTCWCALKRETGKLQRFQSSEDARIRKTSCMHNRAGDSAYTKAIEK